MVTTALKSMIACCLAGLMTSAIDVGQDKPDKVGEPRPFEIASGIYEVSGENATHRYQGGGMIIRQGKTYILRTTHDSVGVGMRAGDKLAVSWKGGVLLILTVEDGKLVGQWTNGGTGEVYPETWELLKAYESSGLGGR